MGGGTQVLKLPLAKSFSVAVNTSDERVSARKFVKQPPFSPSRVVRSIPVSTKVLESWLVGDHATGFSTDWVESQIQLADVRWRNLNIEDVVEGRGDKWVENPNLSRVEEIGFTELMRGGGHGSAGSRIDWIEVYGKPVPRVASSKTSSSR